MTRMPVGSLASGWISVASWHSPPSKRMLVVLPTIWFLSWFSRTERAPDVSQAPGSWLRTSIQRSDLPSTVTLMAIGLAVLDTIRTMFSASPSAAGTRSIARERNMTSGNGIHGH